MLHFKRRAIAYIIGRIVTGKDSRTIYDHAHSSYFNFSGTISDDVSVYDHTRTSFISGNQSSLYDHGTGQYINLKVQDNKFSGYDHESFSNFNGDVNESSISFYDYFDRSYYSFSI
jgi:hypothetical protein